MNIIKLVEKDEAQWFVRVIIPVVIFKIHFIARSVNNLTTRVLSTRKKKIGKN